MKLFGIAAFWLISLFLAGALGWEMCSFYEFTKGKK